MDAVRALGEMVMDAAEDGGTILVLKENGSVKRLDIRRCPEDDNLFVRIRRQLYCSRKCAMRVTKRNWRQRHDSPNP